MRTLEIINIAAVSAIASGQVRAEVSENGKIDLRPNEVLATTYSAGGVATARVLRSYDAEMRLATETYQAWDKVGEKWVDKTKTVHIYGGEEGGKGTEGAEGTEEGEGVVKREVRRETYVATGKADEWKKTQIEEYEYDEEGRKTVEKTYSYDAATGKSEIESDIRIEYEKEGEATVGITKRLNSESGEYDEVAKTYTTTNESGQPTEEVRYQKGIVSSTWVEVARTVYDLRYNGDNRIVERLTRDVQGTDSTLVRKEIFDYDSQGNTTLREQYTRVEGTDIWVGQGQKKVTYYDTKHTPTGTVYFSWGQDTTATEETYTWLFDRKTGAGRFDYEKDDKGRITAEVSYAWVDSVSDWAAKSKRTEYEFDEEGRKTRELIYNYIEDGETWQLAEKRRYEYDAEGRLTTAETMKRLASASTETWQGTRTVTEYDEQGRQTMVYTYMYHYLSGIWIKKEQFTYTYDENGIGKQHRDLTSTLTASSTNRIEYWYGENMLTQRTYLYSKKTGLWSYASGGLRQYTYDEEGRLVKEEYRTADDEDEVWQNSYVTTYYYTADGREDKKQQHTWDEHLQEWYLSLDEYYTYSETGTKTRHQVFSGGVYTDLKTGKQYN